jgi:hypothetical protein
MHGSLGNRPTFPYLTTSQQPLPLVRPNLARAMTCSIQLRTTNTGLSLPATTYRLAATLIYNLLYHDRILLNGLKRIRVEVDGMHF